MKLPPTLQWVAAAPLLSKEEQLQLVAASRGGDTVAADLLVRSVSRALLGLSIRLSRSTGLDVEDLFSVALLGALRSFESFDATRGASVVGWALVQARGEIRPLVVRTFKRDRLSTSLEDLLSNDSDPVDPETPSPEDVAAHKQLRENVLRAKHNVMKRASKVEKTVMHGRYDEETEKTYAQLARRVGRTKQAMTAAEARVLARIRKALDPSGDP